MSIKQTSFFQWIHVPKTPPNKLKQTLIPFRKAQQQRIKQMCFGLKDESSYQQQSSQFFGFFWVRALDKCVPLFGFESVQMNVWNLFVMLAILYNLFMTPIAIFFTQNVYKFETENIWGITLNSIFLAILYLDIFVTFNTTIIRKAKIIKHRSLIFKSYTKAKFWIDLAAVISLTIYLGSNNYSTKFVRIIFYLKIWNLIDLDNSLFQSLSVTKPFLAVYRLLRMAILIWFLSSWASCGFFSIDYYYYQQRGSYYINNQLWLTGSTAVNGLNILQSFQWNVWYEYALYWAFQTEATVGYGDLTARNPSEVIYNNFIILVMTLIFAFFINSVQEILNDISQVPQRTSQWLNMHIYLKGLKLPHKVINQISSNMEQLIKNNQKTLLQQLVTSVPSQEIIIEFYLATRLKFFNTNLVFESLMNEHGSDHNIWKKLILSLEEQTFLGQQTIYQNQDNANYIYYLKTGLVKLMYPVLKTETIIKPNDSFGIQEFFSTGRRGHTASTFSFSTVFRLNIERMIDILKTYPTIYVTIEILQEKYFFISEQILMKENKQFRFQCLRCKTKDHYTERCPLISYQKPQIFHKKQKQVVKAIAQRKLHTRSNWRSKKGADKVCDYQTQSLDKVFVWSTYYPIHNINTF